MTTISVETPFDVTVKTANGHMTILFRDNQEDLKDFILKIRSLEKYLGLCRGMEHVTFNMCDKGY